jgi:hypothetical protein
VSAKTEYLEREQRYARPVAIVTALGVSLFVVAAIGPALAGMTTSGRDAQQLRDFHDHASGLLAFSIVSAIAVLLVTPCLVYLFRAARARNPRVRREMIGLIYIGFVLLAVSLVLSWVARHDTANMFVQEVAGRKFPSHFAKGLLDDSSLGQTAGALLLPAALALITSTIYVSLQALRTGLLTRFWGTFGMAVGAGFLFLGPIGIVLWLAYVAVLIGGWLPSGRPPAWTTGEAMPWPKPGEQPQRGAGGDPSSPGREPGGDPAAPGRAAEEAAGIGSVVEGEAQPVQRQPGERRKRKRRQQPDSG